jgi:hypothetical protein
MKSIQTTDSSNVNGSRRIRALDEIVKLVGEGNVASRSLITPFRQARFLSDRGPHIQDCVGFSALSSTTRNY